MGKKLSKKLRVILLKPYAYPQQFNFTSQMQIKEIIIWPPNDYGSSLEKVLKLPQLHFSKGPHYCKEVISLNAQSAWLPWGRRQTRQK